MSVDYRCEPLYLVDNMDLPYVKLELGIYGVKQYFFVSLLLQLMWVYDEDVGMNCREVTFVPGLYKIFDEILGEYFLRM